MGGSELSHPEAPEIDRPRMQGFNEVARLITVYGTPILLVLMGSYLVHNAFGRGSYAGLRSFAAVLLPVVVGSFLYVFNRELLQRVGSVSTVIGFFTGFGLGVAVMFVLRVMGRGSAIPLPELLVSGCFSVLVFSSASTRGDKGLAYYYGVMCGLLLYVILLGFPLSQ